MRSSTSLPVSGSWAAIASSGATTTSHTVASLTNGTRYYFQIRATNANGNSPASNTATIQLAASPSTAVSITDANLRTALETATGKSVGATITQLDMAKLTDFSSPRSSISAVTGLEHAVNMRALNLWGNSLTDVSALAGLTSLESLNLNGNSISSVSPLANLTALTNLQLAFNPISDLSPLANLTSLTTLILQGNATISDLSPLSGLTSLTWLGLGYNRSISDVTPLGGLTSLITLDLRRSSISDVSPLADLTSLDDLHLDDNSISDLSPLAGLTGLRWLFLADNPIGLSDIPLASFPHLLGLGLSGSWLSDSILSMVSTRYPQLQVLVLKGGRISDLTPLAGQAGLWRLRLQGNAISDLSPLTGLTELRYLRLDENSISDLSPLADLTLTTLSLTDNVISDLSPLLSNADFDSGTVSLGSNPLSAESVNTHIPALEARGVTVVFDPLPTSPPVAPRLVVDRTQSTGPATIRWRDPVDHTIVRYELRRAAGPAPTGSAFGEWGPVAGSNKRTTDHALYIPEDGWHTFEVRAVNASGNGPAARFQLLVGANNSPVATGSISDASLAPGEQLVVDIAGYFSDADFTDTLTFSAASSRSAVAAVRLDGTTLTVTAVAEGQAEITVRARDNHDATASLSFLATVGNPVSFGGGDDGAGVEAAIASAPEGGIAEVTIAMAAARTVDVSFAYTFGPDGDPATADADAADHGGEGGTVTIPAGETEATIRIPILDDDDIEPAREAFAVTLTPTDGVGVAVSSAVVHIAEGVCDRTWQVADALRGGRACEVVTPAELARRRTTRLRDAGLAQLQPLDFLGLAGMTVLILDDNGLSALPEGLLAGSPKLRVLRLRGNRFETLPTLGSAPALIELDLTGNLLTELPPKPLADLPALGYLYLAGNQIAALPADLLAEAENLRILELQDNALETLPEGLFAGVPKLLSLQLQGNPGAPFSLAVELARVEAEGEEGDGDGDAGGEAGDGDGDAADGQETENEPGRAEIRLRVPHGAPFAIEAGISAPGATLSAQTAAVAAGETLGGAVSVIRSVSGNDANAAVTIEITSVPNLPTTTCGDDFDEYRCFRGFELTPGSPVTLFEPPAARTPTPRMR